jgi:flagellin-like protein
MEVRERMWRKDERAVSPVIGVILMVAITVILAAVIASFVFGMGSTVKKTYVVAATASEIYNTSSGSYDIIITYQGGPDNNYVQSLAVTTPCSKTLGTTPGSTAVCYGAGTSGKSDHVVVTATFNDGTSTVILDTYV